MLQESGSPWELVGYILDAMHMTDTYIMRVLWIWIWIKKELRAYDLLSLIVCLLLDDVRRFQEGK